MSAQKRWRLVCYDVREPARWRKVYGIVRGAGVHVQYSIFRCRLDDREVEKLRWELSRVLASEDALLIVDLCPRCAANVVSRNHVDGWDEEPVTFRIIGGDGPATPARDQAPGDDSSPVRTEPSEAGEIAGERRTLETE